MLSPCQAGAGLSYKRGMSHTLSVRLPAGLARRLDAAAAKRGQRRSALVVAALESHLPAGADYDWTADLAALPESVFHRPRTKGLRPRL